MKKNTHRDHPGTSSRRSSRCRTGKQGSIGRWAFNLTGETLFPLGVIANVRKAAYRTATGELRFLSL